ncbi:MAG: transposase [Rhodospirillales bacterium]|nr:transposase [Rhodospirillales bacterium]
MEKRDRRACARIEATRLGLDIRFVVTSLAAGSAEHVYEVLCCARGQAENLIKLPKSQLASERTSCRAPLASPPGSPYRRLLADARRSRRHPKDARSLAVAEFATLRLRLLKIGARVIETASRVRLAFVAACPEAPLFRHLAIALAGP